MKTLQDKSNTIVKRTVAALDSARSKGSTLSSKNTFKVESNPKSPGKK
jgi:hypothetical protein